MSEFIVSARKYRPLVWSDVIGQEHIARTLKNALKKQQIAHALLFCGPRGVGKTTCARILARVLNCESPTADWEPCNTCSLCQAFQDNASFNIIELDAASNNSVENIRNLTEQVRYQPQQGKYKIFIIDEVHMLSTSAFNAFLKTLEEPPPYAIFILATTEKHKILPTILSRCQIYDFRRIQIPDIVIQLKKICEIEHIKAEDDALHLIALKADGALRDALSIFDRITSFSGETLSKNDVLETLNILDYDYYFEIIDACLTEQIVGAMQLFDKVIKNGFDPEIFLEGLGQHVRDLMVCKDINMRSLFEGSDQLKSKYINQAENCTQGFLTTALDLINQSDVNLGRARNKRLHTEVLLNRLCFLQRKKNLIENPSPVLQKQEQQQVNPSYFSAPLNKTVPAVRVSSPVPAEEEIIEVSVSRPKSPLIDKLAGNIPQMQTLEHITKKLKQEDESTKNATNPFTIELVMQLWKEYASNVSSQSLKIVLMEAQIVLQDKQIIASVGTQHAKNTILQDRELMEKIRDYFQLKMLELIVEVNPELAPKEALIKPKQLYNAKEKYDVMVMKNPALKDFKESFDLTLSED